MVEQPPIVGGQLVADLRLRPLRKLRVGVEEVLYLRAPALHQVAGETLAVAAVDVAGEILGQFGEVPRQQAQQRTERGVLARVGRGGDEDQMTVRVRGQVPDQGMALVATRGSSLVGAGTGVGLVHDHQLGTRPDEVVSATVRLDEVDRHDHVGVPLEDRLVQGESALQAGGGRGEHQFGVDVELFAQLGLPLLCQMRRAEYGQALGVSLGHELRRDQSGFDGLADAHVVSDEKTHWVEAQRHQQRHELVGPRVAADPGHRPERPCARPEPEPQSVAQQAGRVGVAEMPDRVGRTEAGRLDRLDLGEDAGRLVVSAPQRPHDHQLGHVVRQHNPVPPTSRDKRTRRVRHSRPDATSRGLEALDGMARLCQNLRHSAVVGHPSGGLRRQHPQYPQQLLVVSGEVTLENWLVMSDPVAQCA